MKFEKFAPASRSFPLYYFDANGFYTETSTQNYNCPPFTSWPANSTPIAPNLSACDADERPQFDVTTEVWTNVENPVIVAEKAAAAKAEADAKEAEAAKEQAAEQAAQAAEAKKEQTLKDAAITANQNLQFSQAMGTDTPAQTAQLQATLDSARKAYIAFIDGNKSTTSTTTKSQVAATTEATKATAPVTPAVHA